MKRILRLNAKAEANLQAVLFIKQRVEAKVFPRALFYVVSFLCWLLFFWNFQIAKIVKIFH